MNSIKDIVECDESGFEFEDEEEDADTIEFNMKKDLIKKKAKRNKTNE